jgi:hypothetical protein
MTDVLLQLVVIDPLTSYIITPRVPDVPVGVSPDLACAAPVAGADPLIILVLVRM